MGLMTSDKLVLENIVNSVNMISSSEDEICSPFAFDVLSEFYINIITTGVSINNAI